MKVFGIPLRVDPSFLMISVVLAFGRLDEPAALASWVVVVFVSVLLHELGHAFAGRSFGMTPAIALYGMGGLTYWTEGKPIGPLRSIAVSLAGPFAGFAFGGIVLAVSEAAFGGTPRPEHGFAGQLVWDLLWVNIGWGVLNLLPILPLDGGNVLKGVVDLITRGRGDVPARVISLVLAILLGLICLRYGQLWGGILAMFFAYDNGSELYKAWQTRSDPKTAYNMARLLARNGRLDEAVVWLRRAVAAGFRDAHIIANDPDFAPLRPLPEFQELLEEL
jgi:stage IV sporulation protein FB